MPLSHGRVAASSIRVRHEPSGLQSLTSTTSNRDATEERTSSSRVTSSGMMAALPYTGMTTETSIGSAIVFSHQATRVPGVETHAEACRERHRVAAVDIVSRALVDARAHRCPAEHLLEDVD